MTTASPTALPSRGRAHLLAQQCLAELRRTARTPEAVVGLVAMPMILFALFGLPNAGQRLPRGTDVGAMLFVSFSCYGVVSSALFEMCAGLAAERRWPWLRRLRATAMPRWGYFGAKLADNLAVNLLVVLGTLALAMLAGGVRLAPGRLAATIGVLVLGTVVFAPMGMALGYLVRPKAATVLANVIFLPLSFCSGFFYPLSQVPSVIREAAPVLPTYHYGQIAWQTIAPREDAEAYTGVPLDPGMLGHLGVVAVWFTVAVALAAWGFRRDIDRERGE